MGKQEIFTQSKLLKKTSGKFIIRDFIFIVSNWKWDSYSGRIIVKELKWKMYDGRFNYLKWKNYSGRIIARAGGRCIVGDLKWENYT